MFSGIWDLAKNVFGGIGDLIVAAFKFDGKGIREAIQRMKGGFSQFGAEVGSAFTKAYDEEIARSKAEAAAKEKASAGEASPGRCRCRRRRPIRLRRACRHPGLP